MKGQAIILSVMCIAGLSATLASAQILSTAQPKRTYEFRSSHQSSSRHWFLPGLRPDRQSNFKPAVAYQNLPVSSSTVVGESFWVGSITQQSYNKGKMGRYYYWDLQGNLRDSFFFLDIAGKNKRGLKLVFPRNRALF